MRPEYFIYALAAVVLTLGLWNLVRYDQVGIASWYGEPFHGRRTSSGEIYDMHQLTAAHLTLPFGTIVRVTDLETGKSVVVRINDCGPYVQGRIIDLSFAAAEKLGMVRKGLAKVGLKVLKYPDAPPKKRCLADNR
ncbi:MAG: septal ring lytic transglycosylase RlpA family protein [Candidatus Bipolaricaulota bacterium]|nr:septal ring lytic transglycosylase RlpA family protein [Candidatus Bipolaricaulota bacterium]MDW8328902.1 septal ring lytic transglycosylase RlpA family protein [Candidatus Bipolaricaulota bacterium]